MKQYHIRRAAAPVDLASPFEAWSSCEIMSISAPAPGDWPYRPETELRLQYDDRGLYGLFQVKNDDAIRCVCREFQGEVCKDSCVELFLCPMHGVGYSNFEINASGKFLTMHIEDETVDENTIVEEFQKGYTYRDTIVRYSMVKVAN